MADGGIGSENPLERRSGDRRVLGRLDRDDAARHHLGDADHPPAVRAVDEHEKPTVARQQRADGRFDGKRAAALDGHADMGSLAAG